MKYTIHKLGVPPWPWKPPDEDHIFFSRNPTSGKALHAHPPLHRRPLALPQGSMRLSDGTETRRANVQMEGQVLEELLIFCNLKIAENTPTNFQTFRPYGGPQQPSFCFSSHLESQDLLLVLANHGVLAWSIQVNSAAHIFLRTCMKIRDKSKDQCDLMHLKQQALL